MSYFTDHVYDQKRSPGQQATLRGPTVWPRGWRWIDDKLYFPAATAGYAALADRRKARAQAENPSKSVRVLKEKDGAGLTWRVMVEC